MIPGTVIELGGRKYVLPPMNVATMELHKEFFKRAAKGVDPEGAFDDLATIADMVHRSLKRNYPEVTLAEVQEHVDLANMHELMESVVKTSGLTRSTGE